MPDSCRVSVVTLGDIHIARLAGELDYAVADWVTDALVRIAGSTVVVDLSGLTFLDARGLSALLIAKHRVCEGGNGFVMRGARGLVKRVFEVTDLSYLLVDYAA